MINRLTRPHALVVKTDVRTHSWGQFVETLRCCNPRLPFRLHRNDPSTAGRHLTRDLLVPDTEIEPLCRQIAWHYGLRWSEIDTAWAHRQDCTVGALHRRLWHIANQTSGERMDYQRR